MPVKFKQKYCLHLIMQSKIEIVHKEYYSKILTCSLKGEKLL